MDLGHSELGVGPESAETREVPCDRNRLLGPLAGDIHVWPPEGVGGPGPLGPCRSNLDPVNAPHGLFLASLHTTIHGDGRIRPISYAARSSSSLKSGWAMETSILVRFSYVCHRS